MRKLISILVALGVILSFSLIAAAPVAAVEEGTVVVLLSNPVAKEASDYCIWFHNIGTLKGDEDDYIDIMFPTGTNVTGSVIHGLQKSTTPPAAGGVSCDPASLLTFTCNWTYAHPVSYTRQNVGNTTVRLTLDPGEVIAKCDYVLIGLNATNPTSCEHHLEIGSGSHTPVDSNPYVIYCAKIDLVGGKIPGTPIDKMNLISVPCYPDDTSIEVVLETLFCTASLTANQANPFDFSVWYWDNENDKWLKYVSDSSFTDLKTIEAGKSYWIKPDRAITIWIHGDSYPPGQGPPIKWCYPRCWNMVGYACLVAHNASEYLAYTLIPPGWTPAVYAVWGWNDVLQKYYDVGYSPPFGVNDDGPLNPGEGYWMAFLDDACIIPPSDCDC